MAPQIDSVSLSAIGVGALTLAGTVVDVPVPFHILTITLLIIHVGSVGSLRSAERDKERKAKRARGEETDDNEVEHMTTKSAMQFPLIGSAMLFTLYATFKYLPKEYVNLAIRGYFFLIGFFVMAPLVYRVLAWAIPEGVRKPLEKELTTVRIPLVSPEPQPISVLDLFSYAGSVFIGLWLLLTNHWTANNIFGAAFCVQGIELMSLGKFKNGVILLSGLFVYDVFWVFGTDVMVTVARSFDAPIKLLFPRAAATGGASASMLGLGDIVIPGIFIALMLRFDHHLHHTQKREGPVREVYYRWQLVGYFIGLATTLIVMNVFQAAQPALLYLVPTCLGFSLVPAFLRGDVGAMWSYSEDVEDDSSTAPKELKKKE